jgi:hypothetical protein
VAQYSSVASQELQQGRANVCLAPAPDNAMTNPASSTKRTKSLRNSLSLFVPFIVFAFLFEV